MNTPDWDDLRYFLALNDAGTLSGAARAIGVEHTTVARRIDALEAALTTRLFDRFSKGWALTAAGGALLPYARSVEDDMHALMRVASGTTTLTGVVRISAPPALAVYLLAPKLAAVLRRLPGIEIDLRGEIRETDLTKREADIALRFHRPQSPALAVRLLTTVDYGLYASPGYLAERRPEQWEFLGYDDLMLATPQQQWLDQIRGERRYCLRTNDLGAMLQAAQAGCGLAVLPHYVTVNNQELAEAEPCPIRRKLWIVMHDDVRRSAPVRAVADEINALFAER
jgi:DNA-binding transcriptional LysR family regulator